MGRLFEDDVIFCPRSLLTPSERLESDKFDRMFSNEYTLAQMALPGPGLLNYSNDVNDCNDNIIFNDCNSCNGYFGPLRTTPSHKYNPYVSKSFTPSH